MLDVFDLEVIAFLCSISTLLALPVVAAMQVHAKRGVGYCWFSVRKTCCLKGLLFENFSIRKSCCFK